MNERMLRWLEEAEEVASPVEVAEQFVSFNLDQAVKEEGFLWAIFCSEQADFWQWRESHSSGEFAEVAA